MKRRKQPAPQNNLNLKATNSLAEMVGRMTKPEAQLTARMAQHYLSEFRRFPNIDAPSKAHSINVVIDEAIERMHAKDPNAHRITCKAGCSACCRIPVHITAHEAALLAEAGGDTMAHDRIAKQAGLSDDEFMRLPDEDRRCAFLADNLCTVYEHRPSACRKHHVISDPDLCDTTAHPGGEVIRLVSLEAEVIASAAGTVSHPALMATAIKKVAQ